MLSSVFDSVLVSVLVDEELEFEEDLFLSSFCFFSIASSNILELSSLHFDLFLDSLDDFPLADFYKSLSSFLSESLFFSFLDELLSF